MPRKSQEDPTKVMPLEERIGRGKSKLPESDVRSLRMQVAEAEDEIAARKDRDPAADVSQVKGELEHKKMILQHDEDLIARGSTKDKLYARSKELETLLKSKMPTRREMWPKYGSIEAQQGLRHNIKFQEDYQPLCTEWQDIQKKLNPDDPYAQSLELIRPE